MRKIEYKEEETVLSNICYIVSILLVILWYIAQYQMDNLKISNLVYHIPIWIGAIAIILAGKKISAEANKNRRKHDEIKAKGTRFDGYVEKINIKPHVDDAKLSYNFDVAYFDSKNEKRVFTTPYLSFAPQENDRITCDVYVYEGKVIAENFIGYTKKTIKDRGIAFLICCLIIAAMLGVYFIPTYIENISTGKTTYEDYRALLIGEQEYINKLHGPYNDVESMNTLLRAKGYEVITELDATKHDIFNLIDVIALDATEKDITIFYYSGHGNTENDDIEYGAIETVDEEYIVASELLDALAVLPGKIMILMDSCGSGRVITTLENGSWDKEKFEILTACADDEKSATTYVDGVWGGVFTRAIVEAAIDEKKQTLEIENIYDFCEQRINLAGKQHVRKFVQ